MKKNNKGVTLIAMVLAVLIMIIIATVLVYNSQDMYKLRAIEDMYNDLRTLEARVEIYYSKYGALPVGAVFTDTSMLNETKNPNDSGDYYELDLELIGNLTLYNGAKVNPNDVYVINEETHTIYYPNGVTFEGETYYRLPGEYSVINLGPTLEQKMVDAGITGDPESLSDVVDGVPIPEGFKVSEEPGENTKNGGLVIIDDFTGSEFVWVPVKDLEEDGYRDETNNAVKFGRRKFGTTQNLGGTAPEASKYTENLPIDLTTSVEQYGGFYIARYEASYEDEKVVSKPSTIVETANVAKANGRLWNFISQVDAKAACTAMYGEGAKVVSHLPYGAEWDSTLQWFKQTEFSGEANPNTPIGSDSTSWGNYYNASFTYGEGLSKTASISKLINTGEITLPQNRHMVNNIYDIAGNLWEWTQEKYGTGADRAIRGGIFSNSGYSDPAAHRGYNSETYSSSFGSHGFRPLLYIK